MGRAASAVASPALALTATRAAWMGMLSAASRITKAGKPLAILGSVWIGATSSGVSWWATDTESWRGGVLDVEVGGFGEGLLPVARVLAMLKTCEDVPVQIVFAGGDVKMTAGGFSARVPTFPLEDYPVRPIVPTEGGITLSRTTLARVLELVLPVASQDASSSKYFMRGALFQVTADTLVCVATDGHQLACAKAPYQRADAGQHAVDTILPRASVAELIAVLSGSEQADVVYRPTEDRHVFVVGADVLITRAIDDKFPAWERIVPTSHAGSCVVNRSALAGLVRRVAQAADQKVPKVDIKVEDGSLTATARSVERGDATEQLAATLTGSAMAFSLNSTYWGNFLDTATSEDVICEFKDDASPLVFRSQEQMPYLFVISPMRG